MSRLIVPGAHCHGKLAKNRRLKGTVLAFVLGSCLVVGPVATATVLAANAEAADSSATTSELAQLRRELEEAHKEIERLTAVAEYSRVQFKAADDKLQSTVLQLESLAKVRGDGVYEAAKLRANLEATRAEVERQKAALATINSGGKSGQEIIDALAETRALLSARDDELRKAVENGQASAGQADKLRKDLQASVDREQGLQAKLDAAEASVAELDKLQTDLLNARARITSLTAVATTTKKEFKSLQSKVESAVSNTKKLTSEKKELLVELTAVMQSRDETAQSLADLQAAKVDQNKTLEQAKIELDKAQTQIVTLTGQIDSTKLEMDALIAQKTAALSDLKVAKQEGIDAVQSLAKVEAAKAEQAEALLETSAALQKSVKDVVGLEGKLKEASGKIAQLETDLDTSTKAASKSAVNTADLEEKLKSAQTKIVALTEAQQSSTSKLTALGSELQAAEAKMGDLVADKKGILSEVLSLKANLSTAEAEAGQRQAAMDELTKTKLALNNTAKTLSILQSTKADQDEALLQANKVIQARQAEADRLKADLKVASSKVAALDAKLKATDAVASEVTTVRASLNQAEQRITDLTAAKQTSDKQLSVLKEKLETTQSKIAVLGRERAAGEAQLESIKDELKLARSESDRKLAEAKELVSATDSELKKARRVSEKSELELKRLTARLKAQQKELEENKSSAEAAYAELSSTRNEISERIRKMIAVAVAAPSSEFIELQKKFQALDKENQRLKAELSEKASTSQSQ